MTTQKEWLEWNCRNEINDGTCQCTVPGDSSWTGYSRCSRNAKYIVDGKSLCTIHHEEMLRRTGQLESNKVVYYVYSEHNSLNIFRCKVVEKKNSYTMVSNELLHTISTYGGGLYLKRIDKSDKSVCQTYEEAIAKVDEIVNSRLDTLKEEAARLNSFSEGLH